MVLALGCKLPSHRLVIADGGGSRLQGAMHGCNVDGDEAADVLSYLKMKDQLDSGETIGLRYITQRDVYLPVSLHELWTDIPWQYWFKGAKSAAPTLGELKKVLRDVGTSAGHLWPLV